MIRGYGTLVHFWLEQASKQVACTAQTLRKLATARGWREGLEIQNAFVSGSLTWLNEGMTRYAAVTSAMVARSREARVARRRRNSEFALILFLVPRRHPPACEGGNGADRASTPACAVRP